MSTLLKDVQDNVNTELAFQKKERKTVTEAMTVANALAAAGYLLSDVSQHTIVEDDSEEEDEVTEDVPGGGVPGPVAPTLMWSTCATPRESRDAWGNAKHAGGAQVLTGQVLVSWPLASTVDAVAGV